jgi:hypothetical protein
MFARLFCTLLLGATWALGASPYKEPVAFTFTANVGFGNSVFVVGSHPDVGALFGKRVFYVRESGSDVTGLTDIAQLRCAG